MSRTSASQAVLLATLSLATLFPFQATAQQRSARAVADSLTSEIDRLAADTTRNIRLEIADLLMEASEWLGRAGAVEEQSVYLSSLGRLLHELGELPRAAEAYRAAIRLDRLRGDSAALSIDLHNVSGVYRSLMHTPSVGAVWPDSALAVLRESARIRTAGKDIAGLARVLTSTAVLFRDLHLADSSVAMLKNAVQVLQDANEEDLAAEALIALADMEYEYGYYAEAMTDYDEAARRSINTLRLPRAQAGLARAALALGRLDDAMIYSSLAKRAANDEDTPRTDVLGNARALATIASVELELGRPDSAMAIMAWAPFWLNAAVNGPEPFRESPGQVADVTRTVLVVLGSTHLALRDYSAALETFRSATRGSEGSIQEPELMTGLGLTHFALTQLDSAAFWLERAAANRYSHPEQRSMLFTARAELRARMGDPAVAMVLLDTARSIAWESSAARAGLLAYDAKARLHHRAGSPDALDRAIAYFDSAAALAEVLGARAWDAFTRVTFNERRASLHEERALAWLASSHRAARSDLARYGLAAAEQGRAQALRSVLGVTVPGTSDLQSTLAALDGAGRHLTADRTTLLYYLATSDTLLIWVRTPQDQLSVVRIPIARDSLISLVSNARAGLGPVENWDRCIHQETVPGYEAALQKLSSVLLPSGVVAALPSAGEVLIVPHSFLATVPFAVLAFDNEPEPFGIRFPLRYMPSLLAADTEARSEPRPGSGYMVADPQMPTISNVCGVSQFRPSRLRAVGAWSAELAVRRNWIYVTDSAATELDLQTRGSDVSVLHIATHAHTFTESNRASASWIAMAPDPQWIPGRIWGNREIERDGLLTLTEIANLFSLRADLVVLAACQTSLGDTRQAEGVLGLPWAFLSSGARNVLASLWIVDEAGAVQVMDAFYRHWLDDADRPTKAEALRRAQADLWSAGTPPGQWGAFQLIGSN